MNKQEKIIITVSIIGLIATIIGYLFLPLILNEIEPKNENFIGLVLDTKNDVKIRYANSVTWIKANKSDRIYTNTYLFTGSGSSSSYAFLDKSTIDLGENSLVLLDFSVDPAAAEAEKGKKRSVKIKVIEGESVDIALVKESQVSDIEVENANINVNDEEMTINVSKKDKHPTFQVSSLSGEVDIEYNGKSYNMKSGQAMELSEEPSQEPEPKDIPPELVERMNAIKKEREKEKVDSLSSQDIKRAHMQQTLNRLISLFDWLLPSNY